MQTVTKPYVLSIAGFDPSAGAGVLADVKTIEANGGYGLGVVSALTYQNDVCFEGLDWVTLDKVQEQIRLLLQRLHIRCIKIGLVESLPVLEALLLYLHKHISQPVVVWDPVLKASAGFTFHDNWNAQALQRVLKLVTVITPNLPEMEQLCGSANWQPFAKEWATSCAVYVKGGHSTSEMLEDVLFTPNEVLRFFGERLPNGSKHGSGCVFSAALAAQLALGQSLENAAQLAHQYTRRLLASNETLLGYHQYV